MPYTSDYSYNYNLPNMDLSSLMSQGLSGASNLMGQRYTGEGQLQDARLKSARELATLGYSSASQQQQAQLAYEREMAALQEAFRNKQFASTQSQQRFQNDAAIREENWSKHPFNPANIAARREPQEAPDVQLYKAQLAEAARFRQSVSDYNTSKGWGSYNKW